MILTVICDVLGEENNGTTVAAMNLIRSMRRKGHTVRVVCPDKYRRGQEGFYVVPTLSLGPLNGYLAKNGVLLAKPDRKVLLSALEGADAVHIITPFLMSMSAVRLVHKLGLPVTAGFHCQAENFTNHIFLMNSHGVNRLVYRVFDKNLYRFVDCIHYPTDFIGGVFEEEIGHPTTHRVISNGVNSAFMPMDVEKPEEYRGKFVIHFTGRYSKEKSHAVLIEAASLSRHRDEIQLVFAGCGPQEKKLRELSKKLPNEPIFRFYTREELVRALNAADLYVHPAEIEIEAISCLEAISCGLVPVISDSPRSATRFFAKSERSLFRCNDAQDLADKIDWWIEHPDERREEGLKYIGFAANYSFENCMDQMERMIVENAEVCHAAR